jgi:glutamate-1-semialdehyde 2,1-aminomutase
MASGLATLKELEETRPYESLERMSSILADGLADVARQAGVPHSVSRVGSMMTLFFNANRVTDYDVARQSDTDRFARFFWKMMEQGVYLPCSQFEAMFVSAAHTEELIQKTIAAARVALSAC